MLIYGTRPEAIKVAPVIAAIRRSDRLIATVAITGQHREMLDQVNDLFGIHPAYDLDIIRPHQSLEDITTRTLNGLVRIIRSDRPHMVAVQGDTTSSFAAALAAFYEQVPVAHIEAGLRTFDPYSPFPEEINRRLTAQLTSLHLAPTPRSRANLIAEGVDPDKITTTGNTVIDALLHVIRCTPPRPDSLLDRLAGRRIVLITAHRRESWGEPLARCARAIARIARRFGDVMFVLPVHRNPVVRDVLLPRLCHLPNVVITGPLPYDEFALLMQASHVIITDSGGVQEEAPSLGIPVLVMRETTERPEAVEAGTVRLVGTNEDVIVEEVSRLLVDEDCHRSMATAINPYGDGYAAVRATRAIEHFFGFCARPADFDPDIPKTDSCC